MPALILVNQATRPAGVAGTSRSDGVVAQLVTCTNNTVEGSYLWTLVDAPIRSALARGTTGVAASFTFTPDVKGTYIVSLRVNGSVASVDNDSTYLAIRSSGSKTLSWRYQGAGETSEDNELYAGLGFPSNINVRGWATNEDVIFEAIETSVWETQNALSSFGGLLSRLVLTDPATGKVSPTLISGTAPTGPAGGDLTGTYPSPTVAGLRGRAISSTFVPVDGDTLIWDSGANEFVLGAGLAFPLLGPDGTLAAPTYSFASDTNTGVYLALPGELAIAADGVESARFVGGAAPQVRLGLGTAAAPSLAIGAANRGWYDVSGSIGLSIGGAERWRFGTASIVGISAASSVTNITTNGSLHVGGRLTTAAGSSLTLGQHSSVAFTGASVAQVGVELLPTVNQSGTSSFSALKLSVTETAVGSGTQRLIEGNIGGTTHFSVSAGANPGRVSAHAGTGALPGFVFNSYPGTGFWTNLGVDIRLSIAGTLNYAFQPTQIALSPGNGNPVTLYFTTVNNRLIFQGRMDQTTSTLPSITLDQSLPFVGASISQRQVKIASTINQTLTSAFTSLEIDQVQTALGSGLQRFLSATVAGVEKFAVTSDATMPGQLLVADGSATRPGLSWLSTPAEGFYKATATSVGLILDTGEAVRFIRLSGSSFAVQNNSSGGSLGINTGGTNSLVFLRSRISTGVTNAALVIDQTGSQAFTAAAGVQRGIQVDHFLTQTGTASFLQLQLNQTQTSIGSGTQRFLEMNIGGTTHFAVSSNATPGRVHAHVGAVGSPSYSFLGAENAGMWWTGSSIEWSISGATRLRFTTAEIQFTSGGSSAVSNVTLNTLLGIEGRISTSNSVTSLQIRNGVSFSGSSGIQRGVSIDYTLNQTSTAGFIAQQIRLTHTAIGSGAQKFQSFEIGGTEHFYVTAGATPGRVAASVGAVGTPSFTFVGDENTGIYSSVADVVSIAVGGVLSAQFSQYVATFPDGFNSATPGITFNGDTDTGLYLRAVGELGFSAANLGRMYLGSAGLMPEADNTYALGNASERWSDVFAVQTTIGDLNMRDPYARGKKFEEIAHWKLVEGLDGIYAYNIRTGKKYQVAMIAEEMTAQDEQTVHVERERWVP